MIDFMPHGGLCNRIRALDSVISLVKGTDQMVRVFWVKRPQSNARFSDLFEPLNIPNLTMIECSRFSRHWLMVNEASAKLFYDHNYAGPRVRLLAETGFDFDTLKNPKERVIITSYRRFFGRPPFFGPFKPKPDISAMLKKRTALFGTNTIGVHIRRTDHKKAIAASGDQAFFAAIDAEIDSNPGAIFFIASDSAETRNIFVRRYGEKVISFDDTTDRTSVLGVKNAVVDLYSLAATRKIFGSRHSTFSATAADIGGIENIVVG